MHVQNCRYLISLFHETCEQLGFDWSNFLSFCTVLPADYLNLPERENYEVSTNDDRDKEFRVLLRQSNVP